MPSRQARHWVFTLNNYTDDDEERLCTLGEQRQSDCVYLVFGRETGESGTKHLQGYAAFSKRKALGTIKTIISPRAHLEPAQGNPTQASDYCKKDGDYEEFGVLPGGQGKRSDLMQVAKACKEGRSFRSIAEDHPAAVLRYGSGVLRLRQLYRPIRTTPPEIWVLWGKTGTGKTRRIWEYADTDEMWVHPGDRWFDGYDGHRAVLFDDFDGGWFKLTYLLKLIDRYVFQVPVKGGYTWWAPSIIYFTSNIEPKNWYPNALQEHQNALLRRLRDFGTIQECRNY